MSACERPAAGLPVSGQGGRAHRLDHQRALPVLQLAHVEVAFLPVERRLDALPAEQDIGGGLHQSLPCDDPLAVVRVLALADEPLEHRGLSLLDLQEQGILIVDAEEERDPVPSADASNSDDLAGLVDVAELLEQDAPVAGQRVQVGVE